MQVTTMIKRQSSIIPNIQDSIFGTALFLTWQMTNYCQKEQAARFEPMVLFIWLVIFVYCSMQPCSTTLNYTYLNLHCKTQTEPKLVQHKSETSWRVWNKGLYHIQKIKTQWSKLSVLDFDEISKPYYIIIPNWNVNRRKL